MKFSMAIKISDASIRALNEKPRVKVDALQYPILDKVKIFNMNCYPKSFLCLARSYKIANENEKSNDIANLFREKV